MSCKAGNKKHKERCTTYKMLGRREINKRKKQERHKKRMERFIKRKENGLSYVYIKVKDLLKDGKSLTSDERLSERIKRSHKNDNSKAREIAKKSSLPRFESMMRKAQNEINKFKEDEKKKKSEKENNK